MLHAAGEHDVATALALIDKLYGPGPRPHVCARLVRELCSKSLDQLAVYLDLIQDEQSRKMALEAVITEWMKRAPGKLAEIGFAHFKGAELNKLLANSAVGMIARNELPEAVALLDRMPYSIARTHVLERVAIAKGRQDLDFAFEWAGKLPLAEDRSAAYRTLLIEVGSQRGVQGLTSILQTLKDPELRNQCVDLALQHFSGESDMSRAAQWVEDLQGGERDRARVLLLNAVPTGEVEKWTPYALAIESPVARTDALRAIAAKLVANDPKAAGRWTLDLPNDVRDDVVGTVVHFWFDTDSVALSDWINTFSAGSTRDAALWALAMSLLRSDASTALDIAGKITNAQKRNSAIAAIMAQPK